MTGAAPTAGGPTNSIGGSADALVKPLQAEFDKVRDLIRQIIAKFNAGVNHINDNRFVLGPLMIPIKNSLDKVRDGLAKVQKLVAYALEHEVPIVSLVYQCFNWVNEIKRPLTGVYTQQNFHAGQPPAYHNENLAEWQGPAKTVYSEKVSAQTDAIAAMEKKADDISKWLLDIAQANVNYMTQLAQLVTRFLGDLTAAAIDAGSIVDLLQAVDKLATTVGNLVTNSLNLLVQIGDRVIQTFGQIRDLQSWMSDQSLPAGKWPQAVQE